MRCQPEAEAHKICASVGGKKVEKFLILIFIPLQTIEHLL